MILIACIGNIFLGDDGFGTEVARRHACARGGEPGTVYLIEPDVVEAPGARLETHGMNPMSVLRVAKSMGGAQGRILLVGCEPADLGTDEEGKLGLSAQVEGAIDEAVTMIEKLVSAETVLQLR
jgi:hydrogenase maturation protease